MVRKSTAEPPAAPQISLEWSHYGISFTRAQKKNINMTNYHYHTHYHNNNNNNNNNNHNHNKTMTFAV